MPPKGRARNKCTGREWNTITYTIGTSASARLRLKRLLLLPVFQTQKLEIKRLFLHFYSIRTNKYEPNQSVTCISYCVPFLSYIPIAFGI